MSLDVNFSEPDEFNCNELHNCIKTVADIKNIEDFTYHVDYLCGKGENYIANVFRVLIKDSSNQDKNVSVIVKTLVNTTRQELFHELHKREVIAYTEVIDKYNEIQSDVDEDNRVIFPQCITSSIEKGNEVIILEDLVLSGFEIDCKVEKFEKLNFDQVCVIMAEMGKLHALSFVFERVDPNRYAEVKNQFYDLMFRDSFINKTKLRNYFMESYEMSVNAVEDLQAKEKLESIKTKLFEILKIYSQPKKYSVLCHGDCWINNIVFSHQENKTKVCFLDFQAMRHASPVTDIIYFLYICTDSQFRTNHIEDIKRIYYNSFKSFLNLFNIDANSAYPVEAFESDMKEFLPFGLIIALIELRIVTTREDEALFKDSENEELEIKKKEKENVFEIRVNDVVNEAVRNGVLDQICKLELE
ncbi:uncharacterized protein [Epargyreus clarus]|uniref:uncharacterized protein n=1 Tax=Epargyreus clarus TaxID=520877 RepID=UPI003C2ADCA4